MGCSFRHSLQKGCDAHLRLQQLFGRFDWQSENDRRVELRHLAGQKRADCSINKSKDAGVERRLGLYLDAYKTLDPVEIPVIAPRRHGRRCCQTNVHALPPEVRAGRWDWSPGESLLTVNATNVRRFMSNVKLPSRGPSIFPPSGSVHHLPHDGYRSMYEDG